VSLNMSIPDELEARLLAKAREHADTRGWPWLEPCKLELTRVSPDRLWSVRSNALAVGMNVRIVIREHDLAVVDAAYLAR
jgi:hypothetical protein